MIPPLPWSVMDDRSQQALRAAVAIAADHGIRVDDPLVLADGGSLVVHLRPAPVVARVPTRLATVRPGIDRWMAREVAVSEYLVKVGVPVVAPSPELPVGPHPRDGFWVTYWTLLEPEGPAGTVDECAALLPELRAALTAYPGELPVLAPAVSDIPLGMAVLNGMEHLLTSDEIAAVRERASELIGFAEDPDGPLVGLHGDLHPGNLVRTRSGPTWIDLTDVCRGPAEWDMALLHWLDRWSGTTVVPDRFDPDPDRLRLCSDLRAVHVVAALALLPGAFGGADEYAANVRRMVDLLLDG